MRGGITSGIVYPRAVAKLAESYDFGSIGGTSAGAMAAAATAAAALRRRNVWRADGGVTSLAA
jgi:predicted acylesterase/phospholipase RssA